MLRAEGGRPLPHPLPALPHVHLPASTCPQLPPHLEHGGLVGHADELQVLLGVKAHAHGRGVEGRQEICRVAAVEDVVAHILGLLQVLHNQVGACGEAGSTGGVWGGGGAGAAGERGQQRLHIAAMCLLAGCSDRAAIPNAYMAACPALPWLPACHTAKPTCKGGCGDGLLVLPLPVDDGGVALAGLVVHSVPHLAAQPKGQSRAGKQAG